MDDDKVMYLKDGESNLIPEYIFHRQSPLSILFGILVLIGSIIYIITNLHLFWMGLMTLMFAVCFISLGARRVIDPEQYAKWIISQTRLDKWFC